VEEAAKKRSSTNQVNILSIAKSKTHNKHDKGTLKGGNVYSERGVLLPVLTSGGE
jgi:hypothetical protein